MVSTRENPRARDSESSSCKVDKAPPPQTRFCASNHSLFVLIIHRATSSAWLLFYSIFILCRPFPCVLSYLPSFIDRNLSFLTFSFAFFFFFHLIRQSESGSASFSREENVSRHASFHKLLTRISILSLEESSGTFLITTCMLPI